jgi:hypothetical protein
MGIGSTGRSSLRGIASGFTSLHVLPLINYYRTSPDNDNTASNFWSYVGQVAAVSFYYGVATECEQPLILAAPLITNILSLAGKRSGKVASLERLVNNTPSN